MTKVIVIGAGLSGLALAQCIRAHHLRRKTSQLTCEVFERDESISSRPQGWTLSLVECLPGLVSEFPPDMPPLEKSVSVTRPACLNGQGRFFDDAGNPGMTAGNVGPGEPGYFLRAERQSLREWLGHNLDSIYWGKSFERYEETSEGVTVWFADGSSAKGDVLLAADGASSRVRAQFLGPEASRQTMPPIALIIGDVQLDREQALRQLELSTAFWIHNASPPRPKVFTGVRSLKLSEDEDSSATVESRIQGGDYFWFLMWTDPEVPKLGPKHWIAQATREEQIKRAKEMAQDMPASLKEVIDLSKAEGIVMPPVQFKEFTPPESLPLGRVSLLGDAAHAMTPFRGQGANTALLGVFDLAQALFRLDAGDITEPQQALKQYEAEMLPRGRKNLVAAQSTFTKDAKQYQKDMAERYGREVPKE